MTMVSGSSLIATECCRKLYGTPRYSSMNFSAWFYWTDGYKEGALLPGGGGLRKCQCGEIYLLNEAIDLGMEASKGTPQTIPLEPEDLPRAILSKNKALELSARRQFWWHLNDDYRATYRQKRETEEQAALEIWQTQQTDVRSKWRKLVDKVQKTPQPSPPSTLLKSFTPPNFAPSALQLENMNRLLELIRQKEHEPYGSNYIELAELYRELGHFEEAKEAIRACPENEKGEVEELIAKLIDERSAGPVRYRL